MVVADALKAMRTTSTTPTVRVQQLIDAHRLVHELLPLWPLACLAAVAAAVPLARRIRSERRLRHSGIDEIDRMSGAEFERRLAVLFRRLGYRAEVVGSTRGDYGADLVLEKDGRRTVVQAKRWKKRVGLRAVQEVAAARSYYGADGAMVVTNSRFTRQAWDLAARTDVSLRDRDTLVATLLQADEAR